MKLRNTLEADDEKKANAKKKRTDECFTRAGPRGKRAKAEETETKQGHMKRDVILAIQILFLAPSRLDCASFAFSLLRINHVRLALF
jgi:hypothetical protein